MQKIKFFFPNLATFCRSPSSVARINGWLVKYEEKEVEELLLENLVERFQKISEDDLSIGLLYMKV